VVARSASGKLDPPDLGAPRHRIVIFAVGECRSKPRRQILAPPGQIYRKLSHRRVPPLDLPQIEPRARSSTGSSARCHHRASWWRAPRPVPSSAVLEGSTA
jgi:hypothetical protein